MSLRMLPITSAHNPRFKQAIRLRQRRGRKQQVRILIDGQREIQCALAAHVPIGEIFVDSAMSARPDQLSALEQCADQGADVFVVPATLMSRLGYGGRIDQWVATAEPPRRTLAETQLPDRPLIAILEGVEKPGNIGAVVRSADAAGVDAVVLVAAETDLFNPNTIRSSRGTIFSLPVCVASREEAIPWLRQLGCQILVARLDAQRDYDCCDFRPSTALVLGSEAHGVSPVWYDDAFVGIRLPMHGRADSLNVSTTAAVLFYEADRQRRQSRPTTPG